MTRFANGLVFVTAVALGACSTAVEPPAPDCTSNEDCEPGEICSIEQGGFCVKAILPNRTDVGLVINEIGAVDGVTPFVAEIRGEDASVTLDRQSHPERFILNKNNQSRQDVPFPGIRDLLDLSVTSRNFYAEQDDPNTYEPSLFAGSIAVSQDSRLSRAATTVNTNFPPAVEEGEDPITKIVVPWQHFTATDMLSDLPLVVTLTPASTGEIPQSNVYRQLHPKSLIGDEAQTKPYSLEITEECQRNVYVPIKVFGNNSGPPPAIDSVSLRYASAIASPSTLVPNCPAGETCTCTSDNACTSGQVCNTADESCALDLTGRIITQSANLSPEQNGDLTVGAKVYTYCDENVETDTELDLAFTVATSTDTGLPRLTYLAESLQFNAPSPGTLPELQLSKHLCLPNWAPAQEVSFSTAGQPKSVGTRGSINLQDFVCCHVNCLQGETPPTEPNCAPEVDASFVGTFEVPNEPGDSWTDYGCLPLFSFSAPETEQSTVRFTRPVTYFEENSNYVSKLSPGAVDAPLTYDLRVEPEVGSVFRSVQQSVVVAPDTLELPVANLIEYRVQLRGRVRPEMALCVDTDAECVIAREAEVVAERIRLPTEEGQTILGPYFYRTQTYENGTFTLPVNPGVYLVSAFPAIGSQGAPSDVIVVDLRLASDNVEIRADGVPEARVGDLLLTEGRLSTMELRNIDRSASITPIDLGSWNGITFDEQPLDLNLSTTCYGSEGRGCRIRQLVFNNADLFLDQDGYVTYSSRG